MTDHLVQVVAAPEGLGVLGVLFGHNESFRGKVQDRLMQAELDKVRAAVIHARACLLLQASSWPAYVESASQFSAFCNLSPAPI